MVDTAIPLQQYAFLYPLTERTREHSDLTARFIYDFTLRLWLVLKNVFQKNQVLGKKRELPSLMLNTGKEIKIVKKIIIMEFHKRLGGCPIVLMWRREKIAHFICHYS